MSIETEKWRLNPNDPHMVIMDVRDEALDEEYTQRVADGMTTPRARAVVVLPEALALLKERLELDATGDGPCPCCSCERVRDVLKRAGVAP